MMDLDDLVKETQDQIDALLLHYTTVNLYFVGLCITSLVLPVCAVLGLGWTAVEVVRLLQVFFSFNQLWLRTPASLRPALKRPLVVILTQMFVLLCFIGAFAASSTREVLS